MTMEDISPNNNITTLTTTTTTTANNTNSSSIADNSRSLRRKWPSFPTYTNHNWMLTALFLLLPIPSLHTMVAQAFPTGAPLSACSHLMPVHIDGELMESASPYILLLNDTQYGGELSPIKLTVTTVGPSARNFMAFMLQARSEFGQPVGRFSQVNLPGASKTMSCYDKDDTLTHTAAFIRPAMEVIWIPPEKNMGKVSITGSVAVTKDKFWAVRSQPMIGLGKLDLSSSNVPGKADSLAHTSVYALLLSLCSCLVSVVIALLI